MSLKQKLTFLWQHKKLADVSSTLDDLYAKRNLLEQNAKTLKTRTSPLAQELLEQTQTELDALNQEIAPAQEKQAKLEKALIENPEGISRMVSTFLEYLGNNLETFALESKKTYTIMEITHFKNNLYGAGCDVPTGSIGIYDETAESFIVRLNLFHFKNTLYTLGYGLGYNFVCHYSKWYLEYRNRFISALLETLKKNYTYREFLKLTIEDSHFTLELV